MLSALRNINICEIIKEQSLFQYLQIQNEIFNTNVS